MQNSTIWLVFGWLGLAGERDNNTNYGMTASVRGQIGIAALITAAGAAGAAESLPPLRVDPALLGAGTPIAKIRAQEAAATAPAPSSTAVANAPAAALTPVENISSSSAAVAAPAIAAASDEKKTSKKSRKAESKLKKQAAEAQAADNAQQQTLPFNKPVAKEPESVAPAPAAVAGATQTHQPPEVADRPPVAPTLSAHVKAGLIPDVSPTDFPDGTVFVTADQIDGVNEKEIIAKGNVDLKKKTTTLNADKLTYWQLEDETEAVGNVKLTRDTDVMTGPKLRMRMDENIGYFEEPKYTIRRKTKVAVKDPSTELYPEIIAAKPKATQTTTGVGSAQRIDFEGEGQYRLTNATYSTCSPENPDWYAETSSLKLDYDREVGEGQDAKIVFKGVPILYSPWMSFALNNQRKSGLLAPTFGSNSRTGFEYTQPIYWNIAPNMDATISPRLMSKRGLQYTGEVRYLDYNYSGQSRFEYLPDDREAHRRRTAYAINHTQNFGQNLTGSLNLNGVSDDNYFTDLATRVSVVSQGSLVRQGNLNYSGGWWNANLMAQRYQTLQDPTAPIVPPYARLPQLTVTAARPDLPFGAVFNLNSEYVNFSHPTNVIGRRMVFYPQLSLPLQTSSFYVTPKVGVHTTRYSLERQGAGVPDQMSRQVPIVSLDSGVTFERSTDWFGQNLTQTLEPRLYYLYVPYRDQSQIPVFDSALADFNFAQIFSENRYGGSDRIGDANQVTAAVTSRLIDPATGAELIRGTFGQRYYFTTQKVTLPGEVARTSRNADLLASVSGQVMPRTYVDTGWQYNPRDKRTERLNIGGRYQPEIGKVMNAGYRYTRDLLGQIDVSAQWPLGGGWSGVARYNFSTKERRLVEGMAGFEYTAGCWAVRTVLQQIATTAQTKSTAFFIQLELTGFSSIGSNPTETLRRNIPGYGRSTQSTADPVFGDN